MSAAAAQAVLRLSDGFDDAVADLLGRYQLQLCQVPAGASIPGSYWGDCEAGLIADRLYARADTPLHSILHEASHWITMRASRRASVDTDASDCELEEQASCYLQVLLADCLDGVGRARLMSDMDCWGYSFRLGNTASWFRDDALEARAFLLQEGLIEGDETPCFRVRQSG